MYHYSRPQWKPWTLHTYYWVNNPKTSEMWANKVFSILGTLWLTLTPTQKNTWTKLSKRLRASTYNAFCHFNYQRMIRYLEPMNTPF